MKKVFILLFFQAGRDYRVGVGVPEGELSGAQLEILIGDAPLNAKMADFVQGYCDSWWDVNQIQLRGDDIRSSALPLFPNRARSSRFG